MASLLIGLLLGATALFLARESRSLLLGESVSPEVRQDIARLVRADPRVARLDRILTLHLGPEHVLVALTLDFRDQLGDQAVEAGTREIARRIRAAHEEVRTVLFEPRDRGAATASAA